MRALRHISGILLATVGVMLTLGFLALAIERDPEVPFWAVLIGFVIMGLLPLAGAVVLLRKTTMAPAKPCPECGGMERKPAGVVRSSHNPWLFHFGGWLFASLWGASREQQVRCVQCDKLYFTQTRGSRIAGACVWVFLLLLLIAVVAEYFER